MDINLVKHRIKKILIYLHLYKEKKDFFTKEIFRSRNYKIGVFTYGEPIVTFDKEANLTIGNFCSISKDVVIFLGGNHRADWISTYPFNKIEQFPTAKNIQGHPSSKGDVVIGNDVWIGYGVLILSGITIGNGAIIAARSVVTKNVGPYEIWGGNPAKFIRKRFDDLTIKVLEDIKWWEWDLPKIIENIDILCSPNVNRFKHININK